MIYGYARVSTVVGLRDRALISVMTFAFARIGAVVAMRLEDYFPQGKRWWVRLHEKGGKQHEMPVHHSLVEEYLDSYIQAAGITDDRKGPLFRATLDREDAFYMVRRRAVKAGI
jgi:site-specific recombinase XerC